MSTTTLPTWQEIITEHYDHLFSICCRMTRSSGRATEAMSEVVCMRLPGILNTYDPAYGVPLMAHIVTNLKWYLYKWVKASSKHQERFTQLSDEVEAGMIAECPLQERMDVAEVVALIFLNLDEYDKTIILLKISDEQSITELADTFGISRGSAHGHLKAALTRARVIAERLVEHQA